MDLNRVAAFAKVVEEGGFTPAARALGLPKSSVSRAVALLEQEVGARLLQRSTRSVTLTEAGTVFYARASRGLVAITEAREAVTELETQLRGPIRITAPVDAGVSLLGPIVAAFTTLHPEVRIDVSLTGRVVDLVEEGFDLALRAGAVRDASLIARRLPSFELRLYASLAYLEAHGRPRRVADLTGHRCVVFRGTRGRATWSLHGPRGEEPIEVTGAIDTDDFSFVHRAIESGAGIGLLPSFSVPDGESELARVLPRHAMPGAPLNLVYPSARYVPLRVAHFRDFVVDRLGGTRAARASG